MLHLHYILMPFFIENNLIKKQNNLINNKFKYHTASLGGVKQNNETEEEFIPATPYAEN